MMDELKKNELTEQEMDGVTGGGSVFDALVDVAGDVWDVVSDTAGTVVDVVEFVMTK